MLYNKLAVAAPLFATAALANFQQVHNSGTWGKSIIENKCGSTVYFWEDNGTPNPELQTIKPDGSFSSDLYQTGKAGGAGPSFKIGVASADGKPPVFDASPITQFEYTVDAPNWPGVVSFDISNVNGQGKPPFVAGGVSVSSPQDKAAYKVCEADQNPCTQGYTNWNDDKWAMVQTRMSNDIVMSLCGPKPGTKVGGGSTDSSSSSDDSSDDDQQQSSSPPASSEAQASPTPTPSPSPSPSPSPTPSPDVQIPENKHVEKPAAPPSSSPAPSPVEQKAQTKVVVVTEYAAPAVVTEYKYLDEKKIKREEHIHQHAHAHQKINKRRHGA